MDAARLNLNRNTIISNLTAILSQQAKADCQVLPAQISICPPRTSLIFQPDMCAVCGNPQFYKIKNSTAVLNPTLMVDIVSLTVKQRDDRRIAYQLLSSLREYLLIDQITIKLIHYSKINSVWQDNIVSGLNAIVVLPSIGVTLNLAELYNGAVFD